MHNLTQTNGVDHDLHTVMLQHCRDCSTFKKQWRLVNSRVEPIVTEPIALKPSPQSQEATRFLGNIPSPETWYRRQLEVVHTPQNYQSVLASLFTRDHVTETTHRAQYLNSPIDIGKQFATLTNSSLNIQRLQKSFSYFQAFVLLVYCAILEKTGTPTSEVDSILAVVTVFGCRRLKSLREAALNAYGVIERLVKVGWPESRATELFFLNPLSPKSLYNSTPDYFDIIATTLEKRPAYTTYKYEDCMTTYYTIPSLLAYLLSLGNATQHIDTICAALKTKAPQTLYYVHKVLPAKTVATFIITASLLEAAEPSNKRRKRNTGFTSKKRPKRNNEVASKPRATTGTSTPIGEDSRLDGDIRTNLTVVHSSQGNDTVDVSLGTPQSTVVSLRTLDHQFIPSGQDVSRHSRSPPLSSPTSQEVIDNSNAALIGGRGEGSTLAESTRHNSPPDGQVINNEPITATTTPTENAESSAISIVNLFTIEDQQRQYSENARSVEQSRHSDLHTAFEGDHQISLTSYPGDVEQTHHGRSRSVDESLPSYGLSNLFPEPCDEMSYCFLQSSSPQITS